MGEVNSLVSPWYALLVFTPQDMQPKDNSTYIIVNISLSHGISLCMEVHLVFSLGLPRNILHRQFFSHSILGCSLISHKIFFYYSFVSIDV